VVVLNRCGGDLPELERSAAPPQSPLWSGRVRSGPDLASNVSLGRGHLLGETSRTTPRPRCPIQSDDSAEHRWQKKRCCDLCSSATCPSAITSIVIHDPTCVVHVTASEPRLPLHLSTSPPLLLSVPVFASFCLVRRCSPPLPSIWL